MLPHSGFVQHVDSGVGVSVEACTTHRAVVPTLREFLLRTVAALVAVLRRVSRVDFHYLTTGAFSLVRQDGAEHRPGRIRNAFCKAVVLDHAFDVQFLDGNQAVPVDEPSG